MKKIVTIAILLISCFTMAMAQQSEAKIKFDKVSHDFGTFSENAPVQECVFSFINEGSAPLIINQAFASCGCTIPAYTKAPVMPGKKGQIKITYNGKGKFPGHFKKTIPVRTNGNPEMTINNRKTTLNKNFQSEGHVPIMVHVLFYALLV